MPKDLLDKTLKIIKLLFWSGNFLKT
jgi:hypothetical protein